MVPGILHEFEHLTFLGLGCLNYALQDKSLFLVAPPNNTK